MCRVIFVVILFVSSSHCRVNEIHDNAGADHLKTSLITKDPKESETGESKVLGDKLNSVKIANPLIDLLTKDSKVPKTTESKVFESTLDEMILDFYKSWQDACIEILDNYIDSYKLVPCFPPKNEDNGTALLLTPYIENGRIKDARRASKVDPNLFLGVESYTGFITVNKTYNSNLFFWYFPVVNKPVNETPWIIWLQGGPGASSLTGLFDEIGPFKVQNDSTLIHDPYTWLQNHSLLFIDNPVGTGYSFTDSPDGFVQDMTTYSNHLYSMLKQFIQIFPELRTAPLFIAGESYAGKYVPALGMEIHKHKNAPGLDINFKGLIMGNAFVDPAMIYHLTDSFYFLGLLDKKQIDIAKPLTDSFHEAIKANRSVDAKNNWISLVSLLLRLSHQRHGFNFLSEELKVGKYVEFLNRAEVKRALHVGDIKYTFVNVTVNSRLAPDFLISTKPYLETLLEHYKVLVYCGHLDQMLPCVYSAEHYRTWRWNASAEFNNANRYPFMFNRKLAGYHKSGGGLTEVVVRGAGHMTPLDAPGPMQYLVTQWTAALPISKTLESILRSIAYKNDRNQTHLFYL